MANLLDTSSADHDDLNV